MQCEQIFQYFFNSRTVDCLSSANISHFLHSIYTYIFLIDWKKNILCSMLLPRLVHVKRKHSWSFSFIYKDRVWWAQIVVDSFPLKNRDTIWVKSYPLDTCILRIGVIVAIYMYHNRLEPYNDILWCTLYRYTTGGTVSTQYRYIKIYYTWYV